jgi:formylmethanofuran--tetrahydromethanopterin N-formyltransferase
MSAINVLRQQNKHLEQVKLMGEFNLNGVPVEDTFCETFTVHIARILVTSVNRKWALEAALETKGLGRSATIPPSEASIEGEAKSEETPDGRPGFIIQVLDRKAEELKHWLIVRIRKGVLPYPKTNVFNAMPRDLADEFASVKGTMIQTFGDGFEEETEAFQRKVLKIPRMDGWFQVETEFGIAKGVAGGMFLVLAQSDEAGLEAAEQALEAVQGVRYVVGKFASSGTKVGGKKYKDAIATTNDAYCPTLIHKNGSKLPENAKCIYEVIVSGLGLENVIKAMRQGITAATKVQGILRVTATNYGGTLGKGRIYLRNLFESGS